MTAPRSAIALTALLVAAPLLATAGVQPAASEPPGAAVAPTNGMIATFAWKPNAHISEPLDLVVMNADGSGAQVLVPAAATRSLCGFDLDWSPDGNRIAWASQSEVWTIDADGTDRTLVANGCVSHVEWAPDGATLAAEIDGRAGLLTVATGAFEWLRPCAYGEGGVTFSPDGTQAGGSGDRRLRPGPDRVGHLRLRRRRREPGRALRRHQPARPATRHARRHTFGERVAPRPGHGAHLHGRRVRRRQLPSHRPDRELVQRRPLHRCRHQRRHAGEGRLDVG